MTRLTNDTFSRKDNAHNWSITDKTAALEYVGNMLAALDPLAPAPSILFQARLNGVLYRGTLYLVKEEETQDNDTTL